MRASKLQLEHYYLEEVYFALTDRNGTEDTQDEIPLRAEDVEVTVEAGQNPDNELEWLFRLKVVLNDRDSKFPYRFTIQLAGFFNVSADYESEKREQLATINAPSLLYGAAREILATVSARSRVFSVFLPPVRFFGMTKEPPSPEDKKALATTAPTKAQTRTTKRKARKIPKKK